MSKSKTFSDSANYAIINISVANLRAQPVFQSELINQIILGTVVTVFEDQNDFYYIENRDGYRGWLSKSSIFLADKKTAEEWENLNKIFFTGLAGSVYKEPARDSEIISDLVCCSVLKIIGEETDFVNVELPDGRSGYAQKNLTIDLAEQKNFQPSPSAIITISRHFLGLPYLWGGTSSKAFDCSGFVQTVYRILNIQLPRNASQMIKTGQEIDIENNFEKLKVGDLLFFGKTIERVTHVAIYIGERRFIHADGYVHINSLTPGAPDYNEYRHKTLLKVKRVV